MNRFVLTVLVVFFISCNHLVYKNPHVLLTTDYGEIEVELFPDKAPKSVAAFLLYVDSGYYKNSSFYRVLSNENVPSEYNSGLIQGGIFKTNSSLLLKIPGIEHETTRQTNLLHVSGTVSLARTTPGSASTEFFICVGDQPQFDSNASTSVDGVGFAAFGKVFKGMYIVRKIQNNPSLGDSFKRDIKITTIERL